MKILLIEKNFFISFIFMLKSILSTLLFSFVIIVNSCNLFDSNDKKGEAISFIKTTEKAIHGVVVPGDDFTNYFGIVAPIAKKNSNYQLNQTQIDSLNNYYINYMRSLENAINKLNDIGEFDTSFNVLRSAIKLLQITKKGYESTIPTYLYIYKIGLNLASESEKQILVNGDKMLNNTSSLIHEENAILDSQTLQFMQKYNIHY